MINNFNFSFLVRASELEVQRWRPSCTGRRPSRQGVRQPLITTICTLTPLLKTTFLISIIRSDHITTTTQTRHYNVLSEHHIDTALYWWRSSVTSLCTVAFFALIFNFYFIDFLHIDDVMGVIGALLLVEFYICYITFIFHVNHICNSYKNILKNVLTINRKIFENNFLYQTFFAEKFSIC